MTEHTRELRAAKVKLIAFLLLLMAASNFSTAHGLEQLPVATILSVNAPSEIAPNTDFAVVVVAEYSASYSTDIAILDATTNYVLSSKGLVIPTGRNSFTFHMTSPYQSGIWKLSATVRVWWHEGWYVNQNGATFPFRIAVTNPEGAKLLLATNINSAEITVDGVSREIPRLGVELSVTSGLHSIETQMLLNANNGTRFVFDRWSDGVRSLSRETYLTGTLALSAIYLTEYLLNVKSDLGEAAGSGWYAASTNATFGTAESVVTQESPVGQITYRLTGWSGDSNSNKSADTIFMDGPKTIIADWDVAPSKSSQASLLELASLSFLAISVSLIALGTVVRHRGKRRPKSSHPGSMIIRRSILVLVLLGILTPISTIQPVNASTTTVQPGSVTIGDATWYHWSRATSDTLLIWLGGGLVEPTTLLVNPCEFESYNTIYFLQDLSKHYDVLALKKGSIRYEDSTLNRTVFREPYSGSSDYIKEIRSWAHRSGYTYLYVVGYSVGAMAAAKELIQAHPEDWASPDGLIIITTQISMEVSLEANSLRASLLLLYGDKIAPEFTASGKAIFENAPDEGWKGGLWFHKEFHVIPDVEHEVWTVRDTGEYDRRAVLLTVKFIETSKALQFERMKENITTVALNRTQPTSPDATSKLEIVAVSTPNKAMTNEAYSIVSKVRYHLPSNSTIATVAVDVESASIVSASVRLVSGQGESELVNNILSGERTRIADLSLIPLVRASGDWVVASSIGKKLAVQITDSFTVIVAVGYSNVPIRFDNLAFLTGANGNVSINADRGEHSISIPSIIMLENSSRALLRQWNTAATSSNLHVSISGDMSLTVLYQRQYYLNVTSPLSLSTGSGWYDDNSIARIHVDPLSTFQGRLHVFVGWSGDSDDTTPTAVVVMNNSKNVQAVWREVRSEEDNTNLLTLQALLMANLVVSLGSIGFVYSSFRKTQAYSSADYFDHQPGLTIRRLVRRDTPHT